MTTFLNSPKLLKSGIVLIDAETSAMQRVIMLQYNPDTLSCKLQIKGVGGEGGDHSEALRLTGQSIETIKLQAEINATNQLEFPDQNPNATQLVLTAADGTGDDYWQATTMRRRVTLALLELSMHPRHAAIRGAKNERATVIASEVLV